MSYEQAPKHFLDVSVWAMANCPSYQGVDMMEVSDVSNLYDHIAEYTFGTDKDANWFKLKWM